MKSASQFEGCLSPRAEAQFAMHHFRRNRERVSVRGVKQDLYSEGDKSRRAWSSYLKRREGGIILMRKCRERCVWVQDCGPVGMLCLQQRYEAQTAD